MLPGLRHHPGDCLPAAPAGWADMCTQMDLHALEPARPLGLSQTARGSLGKKGHHRDILCFWDPCIYTGSVCPS